MYNAQGEAYYDVYRVKADHGYILAKDVKPRQKLKYVGDLDLLGRFFIRVKPYSNNKNYASIYNAQAQPQFYKMPNNDIESKIDGDSGEICGNIEIDKLLYIWVPQDQKAELFYHVKDGQHINLEPSAEYRAKYKKKHHNSMEFYIIQRFTSKGTYIKASEAELQPSIGLKPSNTAESVTPKD